jgi:uncharacterized membrane protein YkoI
MTHRTMFTVVVLCACVNVLVHAQQKTLTRAQLPAAVEKTVAGESKGATIQGFSTEVEDGKTLYEASLKVNGRAQNLSIDKDGTLLEVEDEVAMASLPPAVQAALQKAAGTGQISIVESLTKKGTLVAYEATVKTGTKSSEIQVGPDGKKLAHEE